MIQPLQNATQSTLIYKASPNEGQCILIEVNPLERSMIRFILYIFLSIITGGLFALIVLWYPKFERILYYSSCQLQKATHFSILNYDQQISIVERTNQTYHPTEKEQHKVIGFINRYMKYIIIDNTVKAISFNYRKRIIDVLAKPHEGHTQQQVQKMRSCYGIGTMEIQQPNILVIFAREVFRPLYLFIVFSVVLWYTNQYIYYASVILGTSTISIAINLYQVRQLNKKIFQMAFYDINVNVLRQDKVVQISSVDVVPGDVVFLKEAIKIPFEGVILEGSALINQCALTGQSVPIVKKADLLEKYSDLAHELDKNAYVFEGTTIVQVNMKKKMHKFQVFRETFGIPVCVIRTNFSTTKGQLIRVISFPRQQQNEFQRQSTKFLLFLFSLAVVTYLLVLIKIVGIVEPLDIFTKFLDLITITVPPGLPVSMTFGIIFALEKLKDKQIFCISPNKIISGGRVNYACFDKTGTLTEDFMDFYCLIPCQKKKMYSLIQSFQDKQQNKKKIEQVIKQNPHIIHALGNMAANHSIIKIQQTNELVGDPMQIKLFEFGEFDIDLSNNNPDVVFSYSSKRNQKGTVFRRFQFDSDVQRMSVIATNSSVDDNNYVYCKGSPQIMLTVMDQSTIPQDYHETLRKYASRGFRVLAIASKPLKGDTKTAQRHEVQTNLSFDGFQVFENKLKKQTYNAIQDLKAAEIPCVMITGDNPLTGTNIALKCQIADIDRKMMICDFKNGTYFNQQFIYTQKEVNMQKRLAYKGQHQNYLSETNQKLYEINTLKQIKTKRDQSFDLMIELKKSTKAEDFLSAMLKLGRQQNYQFCLTGTAFNQLYGDDFTNIDDVKIEFVKRVTVYARTKPNDKARIVNLYQNLKYIVLMCGDGANDCGALKQADVGLSLSQAEASISAPFTSKVFNITAVVQLLKECRGGLATNFSLFNIMAIYSLIQYSSTIIAQLFFAYPSDFQYLYWDLAGNFFFFLVFGYTGTLDKLSKLRPNSSLFCLTNLFQVVFMFGIQLLGQICMILAISGSYSDQVDYANTGGMQINQQRYILQTDFITDTPQTNIIFLFTNFMYIFSFLAFSISSPWRKQFYTNIPFMIILVIVLTYSILLVVAPATRLSIFEVSFMNNQDLNSFIIGVSLGFAFFIFGMQKFVFQPLSSWLKLRYPDKTYL